MKNLIKNKAFIKGFTIGIFFFLLFNTFIFFNSKCHHCVNVAGFPIVFWERFIGNIYYNPVDGFSNDDFEHFFIYNLIADILIALILSFVVGLIYKFIESKIALHRLYLK